MNDIAYFIHTVPSEGHFIVDTMDTVHWDFFF